MTDWVNTYCIYHMKNGYKDYYNYYTPTKQEAIAHIDYRLSWDKDIKVVEFITKEEFYHH